MKLKRDNKIWRGIDLSFQNWHKKLDKFWPEHSKKDSKFFILMGSFWVKHILFELKKYREVTFFFFNWDSPHARLNSHYEAWSYKKRRISWHWRVMQNLKKNWLVAWKMTEEFGKFSPEHLKVSKLVLWYPIKLGLLSKVEKVWP